VKRHRRDLEREPGDDQHHPGEKERISREASLGCRGSDRREARRPGHSVDKTDAIEKEGRSERAEKEVLDRAFDGRRLLSRDPDEDVRAEGHELEPQIEDQEVHGRCGQEHAGRRKQEESVELARSNAIEVDLADGEEGDDRKRRGEEDVEESSVAVSGDGTPEADFGRRGGERPAGADGGNGGQNDAGGRGPRAVEAARGEDERERHRHQDDLRHEEGHVRHMRPASSMGDAVNAERS
jgi:hypothetical protein